MTRPTRWRWPSQCGVPPPVRRTIRSASTSSTRKAPRWSTCRGPADPRSSSSAASKNCSRRSCWAPARSFSTPPRTTTRSSSARSSPAGSAMPTPRSPPSLELADVVRKTASLGATYPQIVAILETAKRQKNLPGQLVVDAVPVSNRVYLEAVLGKDTTAKRDDAAQTSLGGDLQAKPPAALRISSAATPTSSAKQRPPSRARCIHASQVGRPTEPASRPTDTSADRTRGNAKKGDARRIRPPRKTMRPEGAVEDAPPGAMFDFRATTNVDSPSAGRLVELSLSD